MPNLQARTPDSLLSDYAQSWTDGAGAVESLMTVRTDQLYGLLAARASDPQEAFGTPGDRFRTKFDPTILPRGPSVFEVGRRIFLRSAAALRDFLCAPNDEDKQLRDRIKAALVTKDVSAVAIFAGGLVAAFGLGAPAAAVIATLLVRIIVVPTNAVLCEVWDEQLKNS